MSIELIITIIILSEIVDVLLSMKILYRGNGINKIRQK